ncbi:nuclear factor of activated T-cells 5-like [Panonychus citri]|uniref:nuclear factor of activated T-cells 5-like n=1 Tax=Panonychus citri TaxID=50023 RepID=UPI0023071D14|nr:nuclear factor of activated T-cells 5-like [Panonychus citri]
MYPLMNPDPEMASPYPQAFQYSPNNTPSLASESANYHSTGVNLPNLLNLTSTNMMMDTNDYGEYRDSMGLMSSASSTTSSSSTASSLPQSPLSSANSYISSSSSTSSLISEPGYTYCKREKLTEERLTLIRQPAANHRARYKTEGSRGAIKDNTGKGFPVIRLEGYNGFNTIKLICFIGDENKLGEPHPIYKVSKVTSRTATPCNCRAVNGVKALEFELSPDNGMELEINCIGILKERMFEVKKRCNLIFTKSHSCRLVFACIIPETGTLIKLVSDPIVCVQTVGSPEIHMTSTRKTPLNGGKEIIILGRNFTRDAIINLETNGTKLEVLPLQEFLNSAHLVFRSPSLINLANYLKSDSLEVELKVTCGDKVSDSIKIYYQRPTLLETFNLDD